MEEFQNSLSYESWDQVFDGNNVNKIFNSFLSTYLRNFYASFPFKKIYNKTKTPWITIGIKPLIHRKEHYTQHAETVHTYTLRGTVNTIVTYYPKLLKKPKNDTMIIRSKILLTRIKQHGTQ